MAGPAAHAATIAADVLVDAADRARPTLSPQPPRKRGRGLGAIALLALTVAVLPTAIAVLITGAQPPCPPAPEAPAGSWAGPGPLGGVAGTGVSQAELDAARAIARLGGTRITPGVYTPTAYLPHPSAPATNCARTCTTTASGIRVNNATRRAYLIASNPALNQYGALAYVWPNPYGWRGPFVVADTGSAFTGPGRLDFYIFIGAGQSWQQALATAYQWGPAQRVTVSATPIRAAGAGADTGAQPAAAGCGALADADLGERIGQIAARHVGAGPAIAAFTPPTTDLAWCAWFASNVWRLAGAPIAVTWASNDLYRYGEQHHTLWKRAGQRPPGRTPPLGAAVLYGSGPQSTATSQHVNLVASVNADGTFMLIGGNESGRVGLTGPCRLTAAARLHGPGCDNRPVYGISAPGGLA